MLDKEGSIRPDTAGIRRVRPLPGGKCAANAHHAAFCGKFPGSLAGIIVPAVESDKELWDDCAVFQGAGWVN